VAGHDEELRMSLPGYDTWKLASPPEPCEDHMLGQQVRTKRHDVYRLESFLELCAYYDRENFPI
jgi:hypothetical protein